MYASICPRCGNSSLEQLPSHSHCWDCNFSPEIDLEIRMWRKSEFCKSRRIPPANKTNFRQALVMPGKLL